MALVGWINAVRERMKLCDVNHELWFTLSTLSGAMVSRDWISRRIGNVRYEGSLLLTTDYLQTNYFIGSPDPSS